MISHRPPTIYSILNSICNFNVEESEKVKITDLAKFGRATIFNFEYPLTDNIKREDFETLILNKFLMRRIGFETLTAFQIQLNVKLNEIMPYYNILFDSLKGWNLFESNRTIRTLTDNKDSENKSTSNSKINTESKTSSDSTSDRRHSDNPQSNLEEIKAGEYATDFNYDKNNSNSTDNSKSNGESTNESTIKDTQTLNETIEHIPANKIEMYRQFIETKNNIYTMIFQDLEELFYGLI